MHSVIWDIIFLFIPFLLLFSLGIEIYVKNPRNPMNRDTMLLMFSLSLFFLGGFGVNVLPLDLAFYAGLHVRYASVFISMSIGLYFFSHISKTPMNRALLHLFRLLPLVGVLMIALGQPGMSLTLVEASGGPEEALDKGLWTLLQVIAAYNFIMMFIFLLWGERRSTIKRRMFKESQRIRIMITGSIYTTLWAVLWTVISIVTRDSAPGTYYAVIRNELPAYCILIWALTVRYAMVKYDFLAAADRKFELLFRLSNQGIALVNEQGKAVETNAAFRKLLGIPPNQGGPDGIDLVPFLNTGIAEPIKTMFKDHFASLIPIRTELQATSLRNENLYLLVDSDYMELDGEILCYLAVRDITEKMQTENKLRRLAYQDSLTGLGNRTRFFESMQEALAEVAANGGRLALMMVDLDQFKWINDTLGHTAGDQVLQHVARQISACVPGSSLVARLGGR